MPPNHHEASPAGQPPAASLPIPELLDLILDTHHLFARDVLSRMLEFAAAIPPPDLQRDERLPKVQEAVSGLSDEMLSHMHREESMLFPVLRHIATSADVSQVDMEIILPPIECMQREHGFIDEMLGYLRLLTDDFQAPAWAAPEHRALLDELVQFDADTAEHVRKENEILFPMALDLAPTV